jgi:hypothetical protein
MAEMNVRMREESARQRLLGSLNASLSDKRRLDRSSTLVKLARYQKSVCIAVRKAFDITDSAAAARARALEDNIDWNIDIAKDRRRFNPRHASAQITVVLEPVTVGTFSHIMAWERQESFEQMTRKKGLKITRDHFSEFFFCTRTIFAAYATNRLYAIHALLRPTNSFSSRCFLVGFTHITTATETAPRRRNAWGKRARPRPAKRSAIWIDLFEVFSEFRRYGIGRRAAQLVPEIVIEKIRPNINPTQICLNPLESAQSFWKSCGFRWSNQYTDDGHMFRLTSTPGKRKRKRRRLS